jgi:hypothetical protein
LKRSEFILSSDKEEEYKNQESHEQVVEERTDPIDEYTGEPKPLAEDANEVVEIMPHDRGERDGEDYLLEEETPLDKVALDENTDAISQRNARYTEDKDVEETFKERQKFALGGREELESKLDAYHAEDPALAAGDIDAAWEDSIVAGEESVGGSAPTPDQDVVDEIGEALGITYESDEPLAGAEKLEERDRERWELDPASEENRESEE